jgi:hypothetical protein
VALRFFVKKFAPAVSTYSLQGHFCALKPQAHKWKYLTAQNTKVENTPQRQPENNTPKSNKVGLVHQTKTKTNIKVGHDRHFRTDFGGHVGRARGKGTWEGHVGRARGKGATIRSFGTLRLKNP